MKKYVNEKFPVIIHGADYNPDQWQDYPDILAEDMRLMRAANCNEMTVGIFGWAALEPREGEYDFSFLDKVFEDVHKAGGYIVLATPSAARPAWMSKKYPEILRVNNQYQRIDHSGRENHCYTSPVYRKKAQEINLLLSKRYGNHPALYAWHISNEYCGECFCDKCIAEFRNWLKAKYGTIERLNREWWTAFWSHTYSDWEEITPPSSLGEHDTHGLNLDWKRFVTHQTTDFMNSEIDAVRRYSNAPITTNLMNFYRELDYRYLVKKLDIISDDVYPAWTGNEKQDIKVAKQTAMMFDLMRTLKDRPFMIMENTPSIVNWSEYNKLKRPGMHEKSAMQSIAHGSDSVQYFQWRKSRGSSEKFHGAVVDHCGHESTRVFREVSHLGARLKDLSEIAGTYTEAKVALLHDWANRWAIDDSRGFHRSDKKVIPTLESFYSPLWEGGIDTDIIGEENDFSRYSLIIAPMLYMVSSALEAKLEEFVKNGGTLVCTYMTGMVNENDLCHLGGFPCGKLKDVFGIWNEEIDTLYPEDSNSIRFNDGSEFAAVDYCELIHERGAEVLARYTEDFYADMPSVTVNRYGKGKAYYIAFRDTGELTKKLINSILTELNISSHFDGRLPYGVTAHSRTDGETTFVFVENFTHAEVKLKTANKWENIETKEQITESLNLAANQTAIIKRLAR